MYERGAAPSDDDHLYFTVGVHPKSFEDFSTNLNGFRDRLYILADKLEKAGRLVAWGEIGLDYDKQHVGNPKWAGDRSKQNKYYWFMPEWEDVGVVPFVC